MLISVVAWSLWPLLALCEAVLTTNLPSLAAGMQSFFKICPPPHPGSAARRRQPGGVFLVPFCPADSTQNWAHEDANQRAPAYSPACGRVLRNSKPTLPACYLIIKMLFKQVSMGTSLNASTLSSCLLLITSEPFGSSQPEVDRRREKMQRYSSSSSIISTRAEQVVERGKMF